MSVEPLYTVPDPLHALASKAQRDGAIAEVLFATDESFNKGAELMRFADADTSAEPGKD